LQNSKGIEEVIYRMKRIVQFFKSIPEEIHISRRDFLLTIAVSILGGIVVGMICSPRKTQIFGSNNGNGYLLSDDDEDIFEED
jgi:hypothetical protein